MITKTSDYDPVCGVVINVDTGISSTFNGTTYVFCCENCKSEFDSNPEYYHIGEDSEDSQT